MKKISIIIPCYNVEKHLPQCLTSVYAQDLAEAEYEVIIVDDGSPDHSFELAQQLTAARTNVNIIRQANKGLGGARNTGIQHSTAEFLLFLDADDRLLPNVLKTLYELATADALDVLEFAAQGIDQSGTVKYHYAVESALFTTGFTYYNQVRYMNSVCNKLFRTEFLRRSNLFFLPHIFIEDFEFNTRCHMQVKRIRATGFLGAQFLQSDDSITRNNDVAKIQKMIDDIITVIAITNNLKKEYPPTPSSEVFFLERLNFLTATIFYQLVKRKCTYAELKMLKSTLATEKLFFTDHPIFDKGKDIFRRVLLQNLWLYPVLKPLFKYRY